MPYRNARSYVPALVLLLFSVLFVGWLDYRPIAENRPAIALFSPFMDENQAFAAAASMNARIVGKTPLRFGLIVQSDEPDFYTRLHKAGAWLVLDSQGRGFCGGSTLPKSLNKAINDRH